jgi:hypothetical protein
VVISHQELQQGKPMDVSTLPRGVYPVRITAPDGVSTTGKLVRN